MNMIDRMNEIRARNLADEDPSVVVMNAHPRLHISHSKANAGETVAALIVLAVIALLIVAVIVKFPMILAALGLGGA